MTAISVTNLSGPEKSLETTLSSVKGVKHPVGAARKAEIRKVAIEFQSLFVEMMLKSMRETAKQDKLTGGGHGEEVYGSLLDREYAQAISRRGNLGLAEMVEKQLMSQETNGKMAIGSIGNDKSDRNKIEASHEN